MIIRTYYIRFKKPLTQTWVEGKNEMVVSNDAEAADIMDDWEMYFSRLYGHNFEGGGFAVKKAIKRWNFCRWMGMPFGKCVKAFLFGKDIFKVG